MRHHAGYIQTGRLYQACIYLLEYVVERALHQYDPAGATEIAPYITNGIAVGTPYAFIIYQAIHIEFISAKPGKTRFRRIPKMIGSYFNTWSDHYKELIASFERTAASSNCAVTDLEFNDFPDIKW
ncbi:DUF6904 family protein [Mucilaginibacter sp. P25]|uniref:DUF6904 family protein n=1 Tax=Mucilaginibacter sp. P25 TaxID=3423945 RepID=UPI003D7913C3